MHQIPALLLQLHLLGERARVCLCVSPSCWTSSRPPPIYREACSGTRARTLSAAGARGGEITVSAGVVGESCARSAYVTTLYLRGKVWVLCADVHRWGQIRCVTAGDVHCSVCVAGKVGAGSLVCLVCGFVWITSSCMRACVGRMGGWRGFHWMSQSLLGNGWWKHLWAVCHLLLLPLLLLMVSSGKSRSAELQSWKAEQKVRRSLFYILTKSESEATLHSKQRLCTISWAESTRHHRGV